MASEGDDEKLDFEVDGYEGEEEETEEEEHEHDCEDDCEDKRERAHFLSVIHALISYERVSESMVQHGKTEFEHIPESHQALLISYTARMERIRLLAKDNQAFIRQFARPEIFFPGEEFDFNLDFLSRPPPSSDIEKVHVTLKQFVRDWSNEGASERLTCYQPILDDLCDYFPDKETRGGISVLVPGAGLGRLAWEIARLGFSSQGNEFSYFMLLASNFILNECHSAPFTIYPFIFQWSNIKSEGDQLKGIRIPDVNPASLPTGSRFTMSAGDFTEIYADQDESFDVIATCFFLDTARNVVEYIEIIQRILKPGGLWINLGPLLYHYSNIPGEHSIELTYEEIRTVMQSMGFKIEKEEQRDAMYNSMPGSMLCSVYRPIHFVATKQKT